MESYDPLLLSRRVGAAQTAGVSAAELRTSLWRRDLRGVARPAFVEHDALTTRLSDAVALMSHSNALGGWASLRAQGNTWFDGTTIHPPTGSIVDRPVPIHCLPGSQLRVRSEIIPTESLLHPDEILDLGGYRVATLARAVYDEMCWAPSLTAAVIACDMALSTVSEVPHTTAHAIGRVISSHHKVRGIVRARKALALSHTRSASPGETRTRLIAVQRADLGHLLVNCPVFDLDGRLLGIADLLDEEAGLVVESDGLRFHGPADRVKDDDRQVRFENSGLVVARVTTADHHDPQSTAARLNRSRREAASRRRRDWTTALPTWWPSWQHHRRWS